MMPMLADINWWGLIARNWAALAIGLTMFSLAAFAVWILRKYTGICLNLFLDTPPPLSIGPRDYEPVIGETVRFRSFDGTSLRGMWIWAKPYNRREGTIIFCHESGSDMLSCARYVRPLIEAGYNIFTFDYRGHGESANPGKYRPLQWPSDRELGDTLGAIAYATSRLGEEGQSTRIGLFGISRGAGTAILTAASDDDVKAVACDSAFSTETTLQALMKRWAYIFAKIKLVYENHHPLFWKLLSWLLINSAQRTMGCKYPSVRKAMKNMAPRPIMLIHGQRDSYIRDDQTRLLYSVAAAPKYMWIVPDAKHNQSALVEPEQYARRTVAFFRRYLSEEAVDESQLLGQADENNDFQVA